MRNSEIKEVIVSLKNVSKVYKDKVIIKNLNLDIYDGEFLTLLGPSGCGKTTILRMISGLESVSVGNVYIGGEDVTDVDATKRDVKTIFQNFALFPHMTVYENIAFGLKMKKVADAEIKKEVKKAIKLVNLDGFEDRYPRELSGGQQQRVAIARGIVTNPKVLLLDESLCSLDLKLKRKMQVELKRIQKELKITFIYVTHDQNEALTMSDRIAIINKGKIEMLGDPKEVYCKPNSAFTADFIGESNIVDAVVTSKKGEKVEVKASDVKMEFEAITDLDLSKNDKVKVMIRPENIKISKRELKDAYKGVIDDIIYMGDFSKIYVKYENLIFKVDENDINLFEIGETVYIKFDKKHNVIIRSGK